MLCSLAMERIDLSLDGNSGAMAQSVRLRLGRNGIAPQEIKATALETLRHLPWRGLFQQDSKVIELGTPSFFERLTNI